MLVLTRLNIGGVSHQAILLGKGLQARGCAVTLVCGQEGPQEGNMYDEAAKADLEVIRVPSLRRPIAPFKDFGALLALRRVMRRVRPHVVQTNMAKAGQLGRLAARMSGVPVILHVFHGHTFHSYFDSLTTRLFTLFERLTNRLVGDGVVTLTDKLKRELAGYHVAPEADIAVIPSLMHFGSLQNTTRFSGELKAELDIAPDAPLIGMVGRLVPVKNPRMFLEAAQIVNQSLPQTRFVLVGDGEMRAELEQHVRALGIEQSVAFTGWRDDLPRIYADLALAIVCSHNEGSPISILEAVAAKVPLVATRVGGVEDLLAHDETGILINPDATQEFAEAIIALLNKPTRASLLAETAHQRLEGRFGIDEQVARYLKLYQSVLIRKRFEPPSPINTAESTGDSFAPSPRRRTSTLDRMVS